MKDYKYYAQKFFAGLNFNECECASNKLRDLSAFYTPMHLCLCIYRQHLRMLPISLLYSDVAKVTGYIIVRSLPVEWTVEKAVSCYKADGFIASLPRQN